MVTCLEPGANANDAAFLSVCIHDLSADFGSGALDNRLRPDSSDKFVFSNHVTSVSATQLMVTPQLVCNRL